MFNQILTQTTAHGENLYLFSEEICQKRKAVPSHHQQHPELFKVFGNGCERIWQADFTHQQLKVLFQSIFFLFLQHGNETGYYRLGKQSR